MSWPVLLGCHFFYFDPIFMNLFANEHKLVLVSGAEIWGPKSSPFLASWTPPKCLLFDLFVKKYMYGHFSKSIFPQGGNYDVYKTPPHPSSYFFHGKRTKKQMLKNICWMNNTNKEAILRRLRRNEAIKEEDMGLHTSVPETRTNLCSFARRFIILVCFRKILSFQNMYLLKKLSHFKKSKNKLRLKLCKAQVQLKQS